MEWKLGDTENVSGGYTKTEMKVGEIGCIKSKFNDCLMHHYS